MLLPSQDLNATQAGSGLTRRVGSEDSIIFEKIPFNSILINTKVPKLKNIKLTCRLEILILLKGIDVGLTLSSPCNPYMLSCLVCAPLFYDL